MKWYINFILNLLVLILFYIFQYNLILDVLEFNQNFNVKKKLPVKYFLYLNFTVTNILFNLIILKYNIIFLTLNIINLFLSLFCILYYNYYSLYKKIHLHYYYLTIANIVVVNFLLYLNLIHILNIFKDFMFILLINYSFYNIRIIVLEKKFYLLTYHNNLISFLLSIMLFVTSFLNPTYNNFNFIFNYSYPDYSGNAMHI